MTRCGRRRHALEGILIVARRRNRRAIKAACEERELRRPLREGPASDLYTSAAIHRTACGVDLIDDCRLDVLIYDANRCEVLTIEGEAHSAQMDRLCERRRARVGARGDALCESRLRRAEFACDGMSEGRGEANAADCHERATHNRAQSWVEAL